jgi:plastocyanin
VRFAAQIGSPHVPDVKEEEMGFSIRREGGRAAGVAALVAAIAVPATADARTKTVEVGPFTRPAQQAFQASGGDANAFFRRQVTIRRGDSVRWDINGFHTVTFVPRGETPPGLVTPDAANPVAGFNNEAGSAFWFNGQPRLTFNPLVANPQGGRRFSRNGLHNSGLPLQEGPPEPYRLRFRRKGTFRYLCIVHSGMRGTVKVVGRRGQVPLARKDRRQARREQQNMLRTTQRRASGAGLPALQNTLQAGNDDRRGTAIFKYFPANASFHVGDAVTLRMPPRSTEVHTFTFGPTNGRNAYNDLLATNFILPTTVAGGPPVFVLEPRAAYPSERPGAAPAPYSATTNGNGFFNTGVLDSDPNTPMPSGMQVRFTGPGTFTYICLIHPFMRDRLTVAP